ncbi:MAG: PorT family protein [Gemmatimonadales bacterium]|nr:PorT family protein [Gemmatimonadales bacterium]
MISRSALLFAAVAGIGLAAHAQAQSRPEVGLKAGITFGDISNKGVLPGSLDTRNGGAVGLYLGVNSGVVGFGAEALYAQRGAKSSQTLATAKTRLDYLDIPVFLKVNLPTPGVRPYLFAGPQFSFEVKCQRGNGTGCGNRDGDSKTDYAGVIGGGVRLGGSLGLSVEGRYVYGLKDLNLTTLTDNQSFKNRTFMILLGVGL